MIKFRLILASATLVSTPARIDMNYYCQQPQYQLGKSFVAFLASFESFCKSSKAPDAAKKHVFLSSLPVDMKFEMQEAECGKQRQISISK